MGATGSKARDDASAQPRIKPSGAIQVARSAPFEEITEADEQAIRRLSLAPALLTSHSRPCDP